MNADLVLRGAIKGGQLVVGGYAEGRAPDGAISLVVWTCAEHAPPVLPIRVHPCPVAPLGPSRALSAEAIAALDLAAVEVVSALRDGLHVFVASADGRQRGPLVAALAIHKLEGQGGLPAMLRIRQNRLRAPGPVLDHPACVRYLTSLGPSDGRGQLVHLPSVVLR